MKKVLLSIFALAATMNMASAQFTVTETAISYTGNIEPSGDEIGAFYVNQPNNSGQGFFINNTCTTAGTQAENGDLGGFAPDPWDVQVAPEGRYGVGVYGGAVRNVYYGDPCTKHSPSIGFHIGSKNGGISANNPVNLSNPEHQKISFIYRSEHALTLTLQLFDASYNPKLSAVTIQINANTQNNPVTLDFSNNILDGADLSNVKQISFIYDSDVKGNFNITIGEIKVGSAVVTSSKAAASITSSNLFPNPSTGETFVELNLKETSDVKVVVSDLVGKEASVVFEGRMAAGNNATSFNVNNLTKGTYSVNYYINGEAAKAQLLMVK